jgi:hypothetical protein
MTTEATAAIGHNNPPTDQEIQVQDLNERHKAIMDRAAALAAAADRIPQEITSEEQAEKATAFIGQVNTCDKEVEKTRKAEKSVWSKKADIVDEVFNPKRNILSIAKAKAEKALLAWSQKKRKEEQDRLAAEAAARKAEADRLAEEARKLENAGLEEHADKALDQAVKMEAKADRVEEKAAAGSGLGMTRTSSGAASSLRTVTTIELVDRTKIDFQRLGKYFTDAEIQKALNGLLKDVGEAVAETMPGAKIVTNESVVVKAGRK